MCRISRRTLIIISILWLVLFALILTGVVILSSFKGIMQERLEKSLILTPESPYFENWLSANIPLYFSIYLFNITNQTAILDGKTPHVEEIGPYVYREFREKINISYSEVNNHLNLSYYERVTFYLDRRISVGDPDTDRMVGLSLPHVSISASMEAGFGPAALEYRMMTQVLPVKLFIETTVSEYIWGYTDEVLKSCNDMLPSKCPSDEFGVMLGRNQTVDGPFIIDTGVGNIKNIGQLLEYRNKRKLDIWSSDEANVINGTDGKRFSPGLKIEERAYIFSPDQCRSLQLTMTNSRKLESYHNQEVLVLSISPVEDEKDVSFISKISTGPRNSPLGLTDLSSCKTNSAINLPLYDSNPRYFGGDPALRRDIYGIEVPEKKSHETEILIEPITGITLEFHRRSQISIYANPAEAMSDLFQNFTRPTFFPVYWFEESSVANATFLSTLYEDLHSLPNRIYMTIVVFFGIIMFNFLLLSLILFCRLPKITTTGQDPQTSHIAKSPWGVPLIPYYSQDSDEKYEVTISL